MYKQHCVRCLYCSTQLALYYCTVRLINLQILYSFFCLYIFPLFVARQQNLIMARKTTAKSPKLAKAKATTGKKKRSGSTGLKTQDDVCNAAYRFMCQEYAFGMTEWTRDYLSSALGFKNARTEKVAKGIKMLVTKGLAENGTNKGTLCLTKNGISQMPVEEKPKTLKEVHERFISMLEEKAFAGSNKVRPLWEILKNRKGHTIEAIAKKLGYGSHRSFLNTKILNLMVSMGLITKEKGVVTMTDKPFPSNLVCKEDIIEF